MIRLLLVLIAFLFIVSNAEAHAIYYNVENNRGICAKVYYDKNNPASYSEYEAYGPADSVVYSKGRTDKNGVLCFLPDRKGEWIVKVKDDSEHGIHAVEIRLNVSEGLLAESLNKPLIASHFKLFIAIGISGWIIGIGGIILFVKNRRKK